MTTNRIRPKQRSRLGFLAILAVVMIAGGVSLVSQWQEAVLLRAERDLGQFEMRELQRLRAENTRLRASQIPATELEALRADHAALSRLRVELDALSHPPVPASSASSTTSP